MDFWEIVSLHAPQAVPTIRYYEQVGVLPVPRRSDAGYRQDSRHDVHRLLFIRRARPLPAPGVLPWHK
jgi:DNA-binding transcriptional MerR regulator